MPIIGDLQSVGEYSAGEQRPAKRLRTDIQLCPPIQAKAKEQVDRDSAPLGYQLPGHNPHNVNSSMLSAQKLMLKCVMTVQTPFADNIHIARPLCFSTELPGVAEFSDFAMETRQQLAQLAQTPSGRQLFEAISRNIAAEPMPHLVTIIDSGSGPESMEEHAVVLDADNARPMEDDSLGESMSWPGTGSSFVVTHHTDFSQRWGDSRCGMHELNLSCKQLEHGIGETAALALGHELIHAAHGMNGQYAEGNLANGVPQEEANTVGRTNGERPFPHIPTENNIRQDMSEQVYAGGGVVNRLSPRFSYSGLPIE